MPVTTIRLDESDLKYLDEIAAKYDLDRTNLIKRAIKLGVHDLLLEEALQKYQRGEGSAWDCAGVAQISLWEFLEELRKREIGFRVDEIELKNALRELS
jgi:predicted transcriptional regulator